jgi:hypothetical protein
VASVLGRLSSLVPFSVAEGIVLAGPIALAWALGAPLFRALARKKDRLTATGHAAANALLIGGLAHVSFVALWGLNYARRPLAQNVGLTVAPAPVSELEALANELVLAANREREGQPEDDEGALRIEGRLASISPRTVAGFEAIAPTYPWLAGAPVSPKPVLLSGGLARLGISGVFFPYTGEPNVNVTLPDAELPFSASHEVAHQRGIAREDEANYVAYLVCLAHPDRDFRYSGLLNATQYVLAALYRADPLAYARVDPGRSAAMRRDERALRAWALRYRGPATEVGRRVNDAYLKAQGQADGVRSYGRVVDLLLAERRQQGRAAR